MMFGNLDQDEDEDIENLGYETVYEDGEDDGQS